MFLQGPDVSSIFAAQIIKQPKRMTVKQCNFKVGEVYLFHTDDPRCPDAESLWGSLRQARRELDLSGVVVDGPETFFERPAST